MNQAQNGADKTKLGFIGCGNMASAIIDGILNSKSADSIEVYGYDTDSEKLKALSQKGANPCDTMDALINTSDYVLFSVKPQVLGGVLEYINKNAESLNARSKKYISIAAGVSSAKIKQMLGFDAAVIQVMPNTPLMLGKGATAIGRAPGADEKDIAFTVSVFESSGIAEIIPEDKMNEIIAVNGSTPAFVYQFSKYFIEYGTSCGLEYETCKRLFAQVLEGSAEMIADSGYDIDKLIEMVSSKGGTTIAGLDSFKQDGLEQTVKNACDRCVKRAYELGEGK